MWRLLFYAVSLCGLCCCIKDCDIMSCNTFIRSFTSHARRSDTGTLCDKLNDTIQCAEHCLRDFFPDYIPTNAVGFYYLREMCSRTDFKVNWDCLIQHSYRLLACIGMTSSMYFAGNEDAISKKRLSCKKTMNTLYCPQEILFDECGTETVEAMDEVFKVILKHSMHSSCYRINLAMVGNLPVHYRLDNSYMKIAACMDDKQFLINTCIDQFIQTPLDWQYYACGVDNALYKCITFSLSKECTMLPNVTNILTDILTYGNSKCEDPATKPDSVPHVYTTTLSSQTESKGTAKEMNGSNYDINRQSEMLGDSSATMKTSLMDSRIGNPATILPPKPFRVTEAPLSSYEYSTPSWKFNVKHKMNVTSSGKFGETLDRTSPTLLPSDSSTLRNSVKDYKTLHSSTVNFINSTDLQMNHHLMTSGSVRHPLNLAFTVMFIGIYLL